MANLGTSGRKRCCLASAVGVAISITAVLQPTEARVPPDEGARRFESTPTRLARGKYIVHGAPGCLDCHSETDRSVRPMRLIPGQLAAGRVMGKTQVPNLTPDPETGAGTWTDDQFARAIRQGIGHDGRTLNPLMPYHFFNKMSDEDLASVVVYLRSMPPIRHKMGPPVPVDPSVKPLPDPGKVPGPPPGDHIANGAYMANLAHCVECHSPNRGAKLMAVPSMLWSGGRVFRSEGRPFATANLTPHASGISHYTEDVFIKTIRTAAVNGVRPLEATMAEKAFWFANMTDQDLKDIFAFLRSLKPLVHRIDNRETPTVCPIDENKHGLGDYNTAPAP